MNPGIKVTSPRSIILAFAGTLTDPAAPTAVIVLSVTTTTALLIGALPVPSINRAAFRTTIPFPIGGSGVMRPGATCATTGTQTEWIRNNATVANFKFFTVRPLNGVLTCEPGHFSKDLINDENISLYSFFNVIFD